MRPLIVVLNVLLVYAQSDASIHHRFYSPPQDSPWLLRGSLDVSSSSPHLVASDDVEKHISQFIRQHDHNSPSVLYQIALQTSHDHPPAYWDISSLPACYLNSALSEQLTLHTQNSVPYRLSYGLHPIPHDATCPPVNSAHSPLSILSNSSLLILSSSSPPSPELRAPPPLSPQGQPVQPVPEKGFLQKYWIYICLLVLVMLFTGGPEEEAASKKEAPQRAKT